MLSEVKFDGPIFAVRRDEINTETGSALRDVIEHFGSVAIAAVRDDQVLLISHYRHPVGKRLWEIPADLLDKFDESPVDAARRELAEEAELVAGAWNLLGDIAPTPGCSEEMGRIFRATDVADLNDTTADLHGVDLSQLDAQDHEEAGIEKAWVDISEAVSMVQSGAIINATAVAAILHLNAGTQRSIEETFEFSSALRKRRQTDG